MSSSMETIYLHEEKNILKHKLEEGFLRKKAIAISTLAENEQEVRYRRITVDENGWNEELHIRCVNDCIATCALDSSLAFTAPRDKENRESENQCDTLQV